MHTTVLPCLKSICVPIDRFLGSVGIPTIPRLKVWMFQRSGVFFIGKMLARINMLGSARGKWRHGSHVDHCWESVEFPIKFPELPMCGIHLELKVCSQRGSCCGDQSLLAPAKHNPVAFETSFSFSEWEQMHFCLQTPVVIPTKGSVLHPP